MQQNAAMVARYACDHVVVLSADDASSLMEFSATAA